MTNETLYNIIERHGKEYAYSLISKEITAYRDQGNNGLARATERQWETVCSYVAVSTMPAVIKKPTKARRFNSHRRVHDLHPIATVIDKYWRGTLKEFADSIQMYPTYVSRVRSGVRVPTKEERETIVLVLADYSGIDSARVAAEVRRAYGSGV